MAGSQKHFVPFDELDTTPHILVDGAGNAHTVLTLSHWPKSGTPAPLKADLSAQIVFNYLKSPAHHVCVEAVSNNHFDEDGLVGVYILLDPDEAEARRELLVDVARAGDFGTFRSREAARVTFTIAAFADPELSPLEAELFRQPYPRVSAALYRALLPRLREIAAHPERFAALWREEDHWLAESEAAVRAGLVTIEEVPALDLAVVTLAEHMIARRAHRFAQPLKAVCHPMAVHNVTDRNRVLYVQGRRYALAYRYESWVQYTSAPPLARVDLGPLAERLSDQEKGRGRWRFDGVDQITPSLALEGAEESLIPPERFRREVEAYLAAAPPAWDPYDRPEPAGASRGRPTFEPRSATSEQ